MEVEHEALQREAEHGRQAAQLQLARGIHLQGVWVRGVIRTSR